MKGNLIKTIIQYLQIETNYAVIINGSYGIGKTYFFKNSISPEISKLSTTKSEQKKYIPLHISLFGISTLEEVQAQIFFNIYPILKKKELKLAAGISKSIIRGIASLSGLGDLNEYIADIDLDPKDWINYDEIVICFDDIDRKSDALSIKDFLGFINNLVENHGAKIVLIANETSLQPDADYIRIKEKVVGITMEFTPDISEAFLSIIDSRYLSCHRIYHQFLTANTELIVSNTTKNLHNLRSLIFFLEHFRTVFYSLKNLFETNREFRINEEEKLLTVLEFSIAIAYEVKAGRLNPTTYKEFQQNPLLLPPIESMLRERNANKVIEIEKTYIEEFKEKYFNNRNYFFFDSIFTHFIGSKPFSFEKLKSELDSIYNKDGNISEELRIFNQLKYFNCLDLSDKNYRALTNKMLEFVDHGSYKLDLYPMIFHFATRFNNILRFNIPKLKARFKKGIISGLTSYASDDSLHFRMVVDSQAEFIDDIKEIMSYCNDVNSTIIKEKEQSERNGLVKLLENNFKEFITLTQDPKLQFRFSPFFLEISLNKLYQIINHLNNSEIIEFSFLIQDRYRPIVPERLHPEREFLIQLKERINRPQKRIMKNLKNASLDFLLSKIDESISNIDR